MRRRFWLCAAPALAVLGAVMLAAAADDPPKAPKGETTAHRRARLNLAQRGYDESMEIYRQTQRSGQTITPWIKADQVYDWSCRWLRLECVLNDKKDQRVSAHEAHLKRMQRLEKTARALRDAELVTRAEPLAAEFFRMEAEGWLADEKAK